MLLGPTLKTLLTPLLLAGSLSLPAVLLTSSAGEAAGVCGVHAGTPQSSQGVAFGAGGRHYCTSKSKLQVRLKWDRPFSPDPTLQLKSGTFVNHKLVVEARCLAGDHDYYVDTSGNGSATSDPRRRMGCFRGR